MITEQKYVVLSLELHMFFARIMKEHSLFLEAGFTPANAEWAKGAEHYKNRFEEILQSAVSFGQGIITPTVVASKELVTDWTIGSEEKTQNFTGIKINTNITREEGNLFGSFNPRITQDLVAQVKALNQKTLPYLDGLITFKQLTLNHVLSCNMFTVNYPLLIEHILREARLYREQLGMLENNQDPTMNLKETELFWDQIMMEHAQFIRGLLDPTEEVLINTANNFAEEYRQLLYEAQRQHDSSVALANKTLQETIRYRDFKEAGTKGIASCRIRSIILPLLADHVLREANHYIRLLKQFQR